MRSNRSPVSTNRRQFLIGALSVPALRGSESKKEPVQIVSVPDKGIQPRIVVAGRTIDMVYFNGDPKHGDVFYARSADLGRTFSPSIRVNSQAGSAIAMGTIRGAQISLGKESRVHVAWNGSDHAQPRGLAKPENGGKAGEPMLYARLNDQRTAFEPQRNLMQTTFGLDGGGTVASDRNGNVYVAWHGKGPGAGEGEAGRQVWIARSQQEGRIFAKESPASPEPTGTCGCCSLQLFADSQGDLYGLYRAATANVHRDTCLLRSNDQGKTFSVARLHPWDINACPMSSMDLIEAHGEVLAAWETKGQVYFAPVSRGIDAAKSATVAPPGANPKRKYPVLARNGRGETLLAWVEGAGWQRGGTLGWQIFDPAGKPTLASKARLDVPVWSFPAVFSHADDGFTIIV